MVIMLFTGNSLSLFTYLQQIVYHPKYLIFNIKEAKQSHLTVNLNSVLNSVHIRPYLFTHSKLFSIFFYDEAPISIICIKGKCTYSLKSSSTVLKDFSNSTCQKIYYCSPAPTFIDVQTEGRLIFHNIRVKTKIQAS